MKQILSKELVVKAIEDLKADGKKVTLATLHSALGNRGSMSTLVRIKAELDAAAQPANDSAESLEVFREVWAQAKEEARKQQESLVVSLRNDMFAVAQESERLEGEMIAAANQVQVAVQAKKEIEAALENVKSQLAESRVALIQAGKDSSAALAKYASEQAAHQKTQQELREAIQKAHNFELEAVRCRALLDAGNGKAKK